MAVMFVHGVPASSRLWRQIISIVDRQDEVVAVDLPGMVTPPPLGWVADKDNYVQWLIGEIEALVERSGGPIHLVGHDWGCLLTLRAASLRPELLRSVAAGNAPIDPHWPLHAWWRVWNEPATGEAAMKQLLAPHAAKLMVTHGFTPEDAAACAFVTPFGQASILSLYRSAQNIGTEWAADLAKIVIPSMLIWGIYDLVVPIEIGRRMASRIGAELVELESEHFWPYQQPAAAAAALTRLWARAERSNATILTQSATDIHARLQVAGR
jgi:pimeloyl-ACP methyl ester carboxylesterase